MRTIHLSAIGVAGFVLIASAVVARADGGYTVTDLTPSGDINVYPIGGIGGGQIVGTGALSGGGADRPLLWTGPDHTLIDLIPSGYTFGDAYKTDGTHQVGIALSGRSQSTYDAFLWSGAAATGIKLTPDGYNNAFAVGLSGDTQIGWASPNGSDTDHALIWSGSAASAKDINPPGYNFSHALGIGGGQIVGVAGTVDTTNGHAVIWSGPSYSTLTDLHPPTGFLRSVAQATDGTHQVGVGEKNDADTAGHALLWSGTATSVVDLHPSGFLNSIAVGLLGDLQIGWGYATDGTQHALLWHGTAAGAVDLDRYLPSNLIQADALGIDAAGDIYGWAADSNGIGHAVFWTPVPEPAALPIVAGLALLIRSRHRRRPSRSS